MADIAYQYRGELVDQVHGGHIAVTDHTGRLLWKLGDPERLTFARSSAKPIQAVPVAESGALEHYGITQRELDVLRQDPSQAPVLAQRLGADDPWLLTDLDRTRDYL